MSAKREVQPDQIDIVASLARDFSLTVEEMAQLYDQELSALEQGAHSQMFLHIFAIRNARKALRQRHLQAVKQAETQTLEPLLLSGGLRHGWQPMFGPVGAPKA